MKYKFTVKEIDRQVAQDMIQTYHYSNTLPRNNKHFLGFFLDDTLVGVITLGYGTRPRHTIQRIFPSLNTCDYYEIGRMCMTENMPRNSESQMLSACIKWIKQNEPDIKVLFTWADGMLGKCGYVYQASNFIYTGYSKGEMYVKDGVKMHVRGMKHFLSPNDSRITVRPTLEQMREYNIQHFKGKQYGYIYFTCDKKTKNNLIDECAIDLCQPPPKDSDLKWKVRNNDTGKWEECEKPPYTTDINYSNYSSLDFKIKN